MEKLTLSAYAKINLTLSITGKRADGYHTLETVMQEISLADTVTMKKIPKGILLTCDRPGIPTNEKNLCHKAAKRYFEKANVGGGIAIDLRKVIPDGAGMGGGSSDAAAVLKGLSVLYPSNADLAEIALSVGADVPFFLNGKTCFCQGIGEEITPLDFPGKTKLFAVILKNCEGLSTPTIFSLFDSLPSDQKGSPSLRSIQNAFASSDAEALFSLLHNDLELPAVSLRPEIAAAKDALLHHGADAAMMTGSGSAVFGLFLREEKAREAARKMKKDHTETYFCTLN